MKTIYQVHNIGERKYKYYFSIQDICKDYKENFEKSAKDNGYSLEEELASFELFVREQGGACIPYSEDSDNKNWTSVNFFGECCSKLETTKILLDFIHSLKYNQYIYKDWLDEKLEELKADIMEVDNEPRV